MASHDEPYNSPPPSEPSFSPAVFTPVRQSPDPFEAPLSSALLTSSTTFWQAPPTIPAQEVPVQRRSNQEQRAADYRLLFRLNYVVLVGLLLRLLLWTHLHTDTSINADYSLTAQQWLTKYSGDVHTAVKSNRPRAAIISLVRNEELDGIVESMDQLEFRWNYKYQYPWIFFSEEGFTEEFKACLP